MPYDTMTDDELRVEIAKRRGCELRHGFMDEACINPKDYWITPEGRLTSILPDYPRDLTAAIALLDGMTYPLEPDGRVVSVEYNVFKWTYSHADNIDPLDKPQYIAFVFGRNPINGDNIEATADTLPRAACLAWLAWHDGKEAQHDIRS